jgi:hypothetical protein
MQIADRSAPVPVNLTTSVGSSPHDPDLPDRPTLAVGNFCLRISGPFGVLSCDVSKQGELNTYG